MKWNQNKQIFGIVNIGPVITVREKKNVFYYDANNKCCGRKQNTRAPRRPALVISVASRHCFILAFTYKRYGKTCPAARQATRSPKSVRSSCAGFVCVSFPRKFPPILGVYFHIIGRIMTHISVEGYTPRPRSGHAWIPADWILTSENRIGLCLIGTIREIQWPPFFLYHTTYANNSRPSVPPYIGGAKPRT